MRKRTHCASDVLPRRACQARKPFFKRNGRFVEALRRERARGIGGGYNVRGYGREKGITAKVPGEVA